MNVLMILGSAFALWFLINPRSVVDLATGHRMSASGWDIFFGRLGGGIFLWIQALLLINTVNSSTRAALTALWDVVAIAGIALLAYQLAQERLPRSNKRIATRSPSADEETLLEVRARYTAAWRKYRSLRLQMVLAFPGWFALFVSLGSLFRFFGRNEDVVSVIALAYLPYISIAGWRWMYWRCPRCHNAFRGWYPFHPKRCYHCGLPKWAESSDA